MRMSIHTPFELVAIAQLESTEALSAEAIARARKWARDHDAVFVTFYRRSTELRTALAYDVAKGSAAVGNSALR